MRLVDGAEAIAADLPTKQSVRVEIARGAGSDEGTRVNRLSALRAIYHSQAAALAGLLGPVITIGGDCGVELASIHHAAAHNDSLAVLWLDAHADLNSPDSSPTGSFNGMVLRALLGDAGHNSVIPASASQVALAPSTVIVVGARSFDEAEANFIAEAGIRLLRPDVVTAASVAAALIATGATSVYIHLDLDVLDPAEFACVGYPEPFGLSLATVLEAIAAAKATLAFAGAGITEFAPESADAAAEDLPNILRIIGALIK